ncbi:MAG: ATP-binding protein [Thermodesulfobacteriota bacterium]
MNIRQKLMAGYVAVVLCALLAGLFGVYGTKEMLTYLEGGQSRLRFIVETATYVNMLAKNASEHLVAYLLFHAPSERKAFFSDCASLAGEIRKLEEHASQPRAKQMVARMSEGCRRMESEAAALIRVHDEEMQTTGRFRPEDHRDAVTAVYNLGSSVRAESLALARFKTDFLDRQEAITAATEASSYAKRATGHLLMYLALHNHSDRAKFFKRCESLKKQIAVLRERGPLPEGVALLAKMEADTTALEQMGSALVELHDRTPDADSLFSPPDHKALLRKALALGHDLQAGGRKLAHLNTAWEVNKRERALNSAAAIRSNIILVLAMAVVVTVAVGYLVPRMISTRLRRLAEVAKEIGSGNRDVKIDIESTDEVGMLARSIARMNEDLRSTTVSRDYLDSVLTNVSEALLVTDSEGEIRFTNQAATGLLGYTAQELMTMPIERCFSPESHIDSIRGRLRERVSVVAEEKVLVSKRGEQIPVLVSASVIPGPAEECIGWVWVALDIRDRKQAEMLRLQAAHFRAIADLSGGVQHNFNNLLQVISGGADLALWSLQEGRTKETEQWLGEILDAVKRGEKTVNTLGRFADAGLESRPHQVAVLDLAEVVRAAIVATKRLWITDTGGDAARISVHTTLREGCWVSGRRADLLEALVNLLKNAVEAMPAGGDIHVRLIPNANSVTLTISDTGIGIPEDKLARIFTPFFSSDPTFGRGLGLSITRRIIDKHKGSVVIESRPEQGTTCTVELPSACPEPAPVDTLRGPAGEIPLSVLAIDDEERLLALLCKGLERSGHKVMTASSGEQGLELFKENRPDAVICDLAMPGMNGWEVAKQIRSLSSELGGKEVPFILLTGFDLSLTDAFINTAEVDALIQKPVLFRQLGQLLEGLCRGRPKGRAHEA